MNDNQSQENQKLHIVGLMYEALADPDKLENLIGELSRNYEMVLDGQHSGQANGVDPLTLNLQDMEQHFEHAAVLFDRLWREAASKPVNDTPAPTDFVEVDERGVVTFIDAPLGSALPFSVGQSIFDVPMDADMQRSLCEQLRQMAAAQSAPAFSVVPAYDEGGERVYWALSRLDNPNGKAVARLSRINFGWSQMAGEAVVSTFNLSKSEEEILRAIVQGKSLAELAEERDRSIETVRTQAKSLLAKTGVTSQLDLVRMFAAISMSSANLKDTWGTEVESASIGPVWINLPDDRILQVDTRGPVDGRPVLFMHNMYSGSGMTRAAEQELEKNNLRLICPWRAGFAGTSKFIERPDDLLRAVAKDVEHVLDEFEVTRTIVVGNQASAMYAAAVMNLLPDRILGAAALAGFLPFVGRDQIDEMSAWPRLYAYVARHFPNVLAMFVGSAVSLLFANRIDLLLDMIFGATPLDMQALQDPEIRREYVEGFRAAFQQDTKYYEMEAILAASDWSHWLDPTGKRKVAFINGATDAATPFNRVERLAQKLPAIKPVRIDDSGQLALFQRPKAVVAAIAEEYANAMA